MDELLDRALALVRRSAGRALLGIAGSPGAGKSTLVDHLVTALSARGPGWVAHVPMDGFHLADGQLDRLGLTDRKGAPETVDVDGYASLLARVRTGGPRPIYVPGFERTLEQPLAAALVVDPGARLVITEGNYLLLESAPWPAVRALLDEVWFVDVDDDTRTRDLMARHIAFGKDPAAAREWVLRSDERNADLVRLTRDRAQLVITRRSGPASTGVEADAGRAAPDRARGIPSP